MSTDRRGLWLVHACAAAWLAAVAVYYTASPDGYEAAMQEDRGVEWATVGLFLAAAAAGGINAVRSRRVFDGLVALFCVFVAGEEFSWGQRLIGYYPPEFFLEHNFQQEANLHNLPQWFLQPKWVLLAVLCGYGLLLPTLARSARGRSALARVGATSPPAELMPWFAAAAALLVWYPITFTGEWVEALAGGLFLASAAGSSAVTAAGLLVSVAFAAGMTDLAGRLESARDADRIACAQLETRSLAEDIAGGGAATESLWRMRRIHKRVWSSIAEGYLAPDELRAFARAQCEGSPEAVTRVRHKYGIDPWGSPYWLETERTGEGTRIAVYSFGPDRRRDSGGSSDDIRSSGVRTAE